VLINAAGAWADEVAALAGVPAIGLIAKRRTVILFDPPANAPVAEWPFAIDIDETCYVKPDAGRLLASPADETPLPPGDAQPEDYDVALTIDRLERFTTLRVNRVTHKWAGLRTFAADKTLVAGEAPGAAGFFLAGRPGRLRNPDLACDGAHNRFARRRSRHSNRHRGPGCERRSARSRAV